VCVCRCSGSPPSLPEQLALLIFVNAAYRRRWQWTGLPETRRGRESDGVVQPAKTLWDWLQLLVIPLFLAGIAYLLSNAQTERDWRQQGQREREQRRIAATAAQEETLRGYLAQMSDLIIKHGLRRSGEGADVRNVARAATLTTVARLDGDRRGFAIRLLIEARLLEQADPKVDLTDADLSAAVLPSALLQKAAFQHSVLRCADLHNATLQQSDLTGAKLIDANLHGANLAESKLNNARLVGANLRDARLSRAELRRADLRGADLQGADLQGADLRKEADLRGADLRGANLRGVRLRDPRLPPARFEGADLRGTRMDANVDIAGQRAQRRVPDRQHRCKRVIRQLEDNLTQE